MLEQDLKAFRMNFLRHSMIKKRCFCAHVILSEYGDRLKTHRTRLRKHPEKSADLSATQELLDTCRALRHRCAEDKSYRPKEGRAGRCSVVQAESRSRQHPGPRIQDVPTDLVSALQGCGIDLPNDAQRAIRLFENDLLLDVIKKPTYTVLLSQLTEMLEEES